MRFTALKWYSRFSFFFFLPTLLTDRNNLWNTRLIGYGLRDGPEKVQTQGRNEGMQETVRNWTRIAMTQSGTPNWTGYGLRMEVWFADKTYTAMVIQTVVAATALCWVVFLRSFICTSFLYFSQARLWLKWSFIESFSVHIKVKQRSVCVVLDVCYLIQSFFGIPFCTVFCSLNGWIQASTHRCTG